ncbi:MAG: DNRLRE domain-containing protein [Gammaproteobacteria bacterium]|nr:DNRLRE domain-containing protein [Gammaproteobacteria bacterium]
MIRFGQQTGYILLPVIVVITLVAAIALLMTTESALESNTAGSELDAQQAQYVAEAGLNHALWLSQQQGCGPYSNLTDEPLNNDKYSSNLTTDLGSTNAVTISVDQDSWIRSDQPTINKGIDLKLHTRNETAGTERPLLRYDLSPIAANASILSATAWFYVTNAHAAGPIDIHLTSDDWTETDVTWDSMSTNMDSAVLATIPSQPVINVWIQVNLTSQVQAWVNGQPNFGITLNSTVDGVHGQYNSRESANPPYLEVVVGTAPTSPALLKSVGTLANGVSRTINRNDVVLYQRPTGVLQLQPDAADGEDAEIFEQSPNNNYGSSAETWVSSAASDTTRSLLRFNMGALPTGARILSANLSLKRWTGLGSDQPVSAHRIRNSWSEDSVTWNQRETGTNWDTAGGDFDNRAVVTTPVGPADDRYAWDITPLVQGWVDGSYPNYGVALVAAVDGMPGEQFHTSDDADPSKWPSLSVTYACECGIVCMVPQGQGKVLMPASSSSNPSPSEVRIIELLESWGYVVQPYWAKNSQSSYNSAIAANDVVYVPATANASDIGSKLTNASIGVISSNGALNDELGIASGYDSPVGSTINISDNTHYITLPFSIAPLNIYSADMQGLAMAGTPASGLQTLGDWSGAGSLVVLDEGAPLSGGGNAAGRRVLLPIGGSSIDLAHINNNGRLIVQRALEWSAGNDILNTGPDLLLVVVNPTSLTSQENAKKALIESWGYQVNLIDESDSQANFDAALAANAVVFVTEDASASNVNSKLVNSAIGVVTEEANLSDEFGFSDSIHWGSGTYLNIDNSHYITQPLAEGLVTILTATESLADLTGSYAPDIQIIGGSVDGPALAALESGDSITLGRIAAGRRVYLPWGGNSFDINHLNDDGRTILQRSLEWAGGAGCGGTQPLLLVVGNATTLSSKDDAMKTLMESWCYGVTLIDDGASQALFDAAAVAADVVYVSGTTSGPALQDKLTGSPTPIVNEINSKLDNFGFSSSTGSSVTASAFSATNASHYISEPFTGNPVIFFTTDLAMPVPGGTLAPDLETVGETAGAVPTLVTLEIGAQRWDGNPAPARRVHLPFTNAEPSQLTADGEILMRRSIEWAGSPLPGPIAHWKLDETSGTTAVDSEGGHDGVLTNGPAWDIGNIDGALDFDGGNDVVLVPDDPTLDITGDISLIAWIRPNASGTQYVIRKAQYGSTDGYELSLSTTGKVFFRLNQNSSVNTYRIDSISDYPVDGTTWMHIAATYDGVTQRLYINGVEEASQAASVVIGTNSTDLSLGGQQNGTSVINGLIDDARLYDRALSAGEIGDLYAAAAPSASGYTEMFQTWSATSNDSWQTVNLGAFGVPAGAVVEVAVVNSDTGREYFGGVRAVGSSLERRFRLHEAEGGGADTVTLHVQADAGSQIQHYSDNRTQVSFILLGYWTGASYVELFDNFLVDEGGSWKSHDFGNEGIGANQVAEIVLVNTSKERESRAGIRATGSSFQRRFNIHEAESGGVDTVSMFVQTDASAKAEVYGPNEGDLDVYVVGYWSTPPGSYIEIGGVHGQVSSPASWETIDLTSFGIPADSVAQFVLTNEQNTAENNMGVRETGSSLSRLLDLQEAEAGGSDLGSMHVKVDADSQVQWSAEYGATEGYFYPLGWWVLAP